MSGNEIRMVFGRNVKIYRNRRSWSQADLAEHANISINFLGDIERGRKWPHPETLAKLADALEIKVVRFFIEEDDIKPNQEIKTLMSRFVKDVSLSINKSLSLSVNQSVEYICKQYRLA